MTTASPTVRQRIAIDQIVIPGNVRELDADHVDGLAASIKLRGQLVPVIVRAVDGHYELVAGEHRLEAQKQLGEHYIDADIRDGEDMHSGRAVENIVSCRPVWQQHAHPQRRRRAPPLRGKRAGRVRLAAVAA